LHHEPQAVVTAIGDGKWLGLTISYIFEPSLLGTAGAVRNIAGQWSETALVVYGDNLLSFDLQAMACVHQETDAVATIAVFDRHSVPNTGIAGGTAEIDDGGIVRGFYEGTAAAASSFVNAGVYLCEPQAVAAIDKSFSDFGHDVFPKLLQEGMRLAGYPITGYCLGVDTPKAYQRAVQLASTKAVQLQ
jgi:NDP-sugar pyrophosphorylase family protein